ncbi:MAG: hypothetical protein IIZ61_09780 [Lachnospiraceae bacterium]|nr:hypothetical protein [Lachnospiraceae bacterium]
MATINSMVSNGYSSNLLFSGLNTNMFGSSSLLGDYAALQNGSYKKLMTAYYKSESGSDAKSKTDTLDKNVAKEYVNKLGKTSTTANSLKSSIETLNSDSLYEKKEITKTGDDGKKTTETDYDWDTITKDVKAFADAYNKTIDDAADSNDTGVLRNAAWMTKITSKNAANLAKAGISVTSDNKLKVDEGLLKTADINDVKSLFAGSSSYGAQMKYKAQMITSSANSASNTYTGRGTYSSNYGTYDSVFGASV